MHPRPSETLSFPVCARRPYYRMNGAVPLGGNMVQYLPDRPRRLRERTLVVGALEIHEVVMPVREVMG